MKLDFNKNIVSIDGTETNQKMNILLASLLCNAQGVKEPVKFLGWAIKLQEGLILDLDKPDTDKLKEFINGSQNLTVLGMGRLLEVFEEKPVTREI